MLPISIVPVALGLLAVAAPVAAAQPLPPRVSQLELENTMISNYSLHAAPGTQVGSEG